MSYTEEQLNKLFWGIAIDLQEAIKDKLLSLGIKFTGAGVSSVRVIIKGNKLIITMNDYLEYIEYGMPNPTSPEELRDWVEQKILKTYSGKNKERAIDNEYMYLQKRGVINYFIYPALSVLNVEEARKGFTYSNHKLYDNQSEY